VLIKCKLCNKSLELDENLTIPQLKAQQFIQKYYQKNNKSPSYRDIQTGLGYTTTSAGYVLVDALVQKQYLAKANYKKRSIIILKEVPCG
jgi:SOS-response transcriptional repressor LexA